MKTDWKTGLVLSAVGLLAACGNSTTLPDGGDEACPARAMPSTWGMGTTHASAISADETWTAADSPHRVTSTVNLAARLTIEPCAVVLLNEQLVLDTAQGRLVAEGTAARPILIQGQATGGRNTSRGLWTSSSSEGEVMRLAHVTIEDIGNGENAFGDYAVALPGVNAQTLHVDTVTIRNTYGGGIGLGRLGRFSATSRELTITGTKNGDGLREGMPRSAPVAFANPSAVATLPTGTYTGNEVDHVAVGEFGSGSMNVTESSTWVDRGVPYFMRGGVQVVPSTAGTTWTLKEGITLRFPTGTDANNAHVRIGFDARAGETASLLVQGTATRKVTFEALSGQAPAWSGIAIHPGARGSRIDHAVIRHTGLESPTSVRDCSGVRGGLFFGLAVNFAAMSPLEPDQDIVRNTTIRDAAPNSIGFQRSWVALGSAGTTSVNFLDPAKGNSVVGLTCRQSGFTLRNPSTGMEACAATCD